MSLFSAFRRKPKKPSTPSVVDLLVVEGQDAGRRFTVDAPEVTISRGWGKESGVIHLHDPTVSKHQAVIRLGPEGLILEHGAEATNATRVNGEVISSRSIAPGDSIQLGGVVLEVRAHRGLALSALFDPSSREDDSISPRDAEAATRIFQLDAGPAAGTTEVSATAESVPLYLAAILGGRERRYPLRAGVNKLGRHASCDVCIPADLTSVSRHHLDLVVTGREVMLTHRSRKSTTVLNGKQVLGEAPLSPGDQLEIGDLKCELVREVMGEETTIGASPDPLQHSLRGDMEALHEREAQIEREFCVVGSFLDVDIVGSRDMKSADAKPLQIVLSFERWRDWVEAVVEEFEGRVLNSNGDELMCFFESESHAQCAVRAGSAILSRIDVFNADENLLPAPFRMRLGVHSGESLVDREQGYAYSVVLDIAGHLQKEAVTNGLLASEDTYQALGDPELMQPAGVLERGGLNVYQLRVDRLSE